jgi:hypothetical protein
MTDLTKNPASVGATPAAEEFRERLLAGRSPAQVAQQRRGLLLAAVVLGIYGVSVLYRLGRHSPWPVAFLSLALIAFLAETVLRFRRIRPGPVTLASDSTLRKAIQQSSRCGRCGALFVSQVDGAHCHRCGSRMWRSPSLDSVAIGTLVGLASVGVLLWYAWTR